MLSGGGSREVSLELSNGDIKLSQNEFGCFDVAVLLVLSHKGLI